MIVILLLLSSFLIPSIGFSNEPIPQQLEKNELEKYQQETASLKALLKKKYEDLKSLKEETEQAILLHEINEVRKELFKIQDNWRQNFATNETLTDEGYALWDQGELLLTDLVMEYGSLDYLYIIPPEFANVKVRISSAIPIPRESFDEVLELVLKAHGIGAKRVSPYAKALYMLKQNLSDVAAICTCSKDLAFAQPNDRIFYLFNAEAEQIQSICGFFERFSDPKETTVQIVGSKIGIVGSKESVQKLLELHEAVWKKSSGKMIRVINLKKIAVGEAEKVIKAFFAAPTNKPRIPLKPSLQEELIVFTMSQGLVLVGESAVIERAEELLEDLEGQLDDPSEVTIFWYSCKYSDPEDIADVLQKVYEPLSKAVPPSNPLHKPQSSITKNPKNKLNRLTQQSVQAPSHLAAPSAKSEVEGNFIVDAKTGSILMVVRKDHLPKIKQLLKQIDVPKKMVQIDVLLVEKKVQDQAQSGINLLQLGSNISRQETSLSFETGERSLKKGILDFIFARKSTKKAPGVDLSYSFLLAQNDIKINANPSILAVNQTPATISIVEEISLNNGAVLLDNDRAALRPEKSYTRAQYGTVLKLTPTIHPPGDNEERGMVTLVTDITFDTTETSKDDRPPVTKRTIKNEVTVADGETIILGGLRRKTSEKSRDKIPFLGDIPGIGKLFGATISRDHNTEMFVFITPKIIKNSANDLAKIRREELEKRPGDIPEFLERKEEALAKERQKLFEKSLQLLFEQE